MKNIISIVAVLLGVLMFFAVVSVPSDSGMAQYPPPTPLPNPPTLWEVSLTLPGTCPPQNLRCYEIVWRNSLHDNYSKIEFEDYLFTGCYYRLYIWGGYWDQVSYGSIAKFYSEPENEYWPRMFCNAIYPVMTIESEDSNKIFAPRPDFHWVTNPLVFSP